MWVLEQAELPRRIEIAKSWAEQNFRIVKRAVKLIPDVQSDEIWPALKELQNERNLIGHGVWMIASDGRPLVVWHAKFLESADWVSAEYFDWRRFDHFLARGRVLEKTFADFKTLLQAAVAEDAFTKGNPRSFHVATSAELGGFVPEEAKCHDNAKRWVAEHPAYMVIEGWLAEDPEFLFVKHSVVVNEDGNLICVTLGSQKSATRDVAIHRGILIHRPEWTPTPFAELPAQVQAFVGTPPNTWSPENVVPEGTLEGPL